MSESASSKSVIVAGARTPVGRLLGGLKDLPATDLGGLAIKAALEKAGVDGSQVDYVVMGQVIQAGAGQNPARVAAVNGGIPMSVPSTTINKVCLSGINAIILADQLVRLGEADIVVAGGMESMTQAPRILTGSREGMKFGDTALVDAMAYDALFDQFTEQLMGSLTDQHNASGAQLTREEQDEYAARSHQKAAQAWKNGVFDDEVVPVDVETRGGVVTVSQDESVRADTSVETLARLRPSFDENGTITAGSASPISDGAAAVVVMSRAKAEELGLEWLAEIGAHGQVAGPDSTLQLQPARAAAKACQKEGITPTDLDLVEFNEAFAAVGIASARELRPRRCEGQRERWCARAGAPGRNVRSTHRASPRSRVEATRRWHRRGRAMWRWWTGRRPHSSGAPRVNRRHTREHWYARSYPNKRQSTPLGIHAAVLDDGVLRVISRALRASESTSPLAGLGSS